MENNIEDLKTKLNEASSSYQNLIRETHEKALLQNEIQTNRWESYKRDHEELSSRLLSLRDRLSHAVMVPIGKRALMRGRLVHTNEILICLGDGWFSKQSAKQAADVCHRRIQQGDEMLAKLKKEEELLISRESFTFESQVFADGDQTQEIIEPFDEEKEKLWREKHRQKEKEYHQKLAELRKAPRTKIETEEDLWKRLDALDLQEELEDELNRMGEDFEEDEEEEEDSEDSSDSESNNASEIEQEGNKKTLQRRVSFKEGEDNSGSDISCDTKDDNLTRIVFKHSEIIPVLHKAGNEIVNPSDIYTHYFRQKTPKSILKPSSATKYPTVEIDEQQPEYRIRHTEEVEKQPANHILQAVSQEVVEHTSSTTAVSNAERPLSRFKAARIASKR